MSAVTMLTRMGWMTAIAGRAETDAPALIGAVRNAEPGAGLRLAMRRLVGGVSVVTAGRGDERTGATVTSAQSLSLDPETMVVSINKTSSTWPVIARSRAFCVNILAAEQQAVADRFAGRGGLKGAARYEGASWYELVTGAAALHGALAAIDCEVATILEHGSHALILGAVRAVVLGEPGAALVYADGRYGVHG